jgi:hydroxymethylpyrimidine pyrophosphatase-like HAD family hydrolase
VPLDVAEKDLLQLLQQRLLEKGIKANLVWSVDEPAAIGLLDVLPGRASKLHAIEFLQGYLGVTNSDTLFAGDSGNDLPVLISPIPSVLVANAHRFVEEQALEGAEKAGTQAAFYRARGGVLDMNGNYSAGILEGVAHYHPELMQSIME